MKMQALVALRDFPYGRRRLTAGDTFMAPDKDARILTALKRAQIDPAGQETESHVAPVTQQKTVQAFVAEVMEAPPARGRGRPRKTVPARTG